MTRSEYYHALMARLRDCQRRGDHAFAQLVAEGRKRLDHTPRQMGWHLREKLRR